MRNPYEYEPEEEPRVCATCARFFEFDQVCNVPETVVKAMKERFGIALADSEIAIEPDRISDCTEAPGFWIATPCTKPSRKRGGSHDHHIFLHRNREFALRRNGQTLFQFTRSRDVVPQGDTGGLEPPGGGMG